MTRHQRPALSQDRRATLDRARAVLHVLEADCGFRGAIAQDAGTAARAITRLLGPLTDRDVETERARRNSIAAAQPLTEAEARLMHGDR